MKKQSITMECLKSDKESLRIRYRRIRAAISEERRKYSSQAALELLTRFKHSPSILSYASFCDEFDTSAINNRLASEGRLLLPRVHQNTLSAHIVTDPASQLAPNRWGILEPVPHLCPQVRPEQISLALIPGLAFDAQNHRIGYGKGYYDRFLQQTAPSTPLLGLGFLEQFSSTSILSEPHDIPLDHVYLY